MWSSALKDKHEQAQRILIGHLLGYPGMAEEVLSTFPKEQAEAFTVPALRHIFEAVHDLHEKDAKISEQTVAAEFQSKEWSTKGLPQVFMACSDAAAEEYQSKTLGETARDYVSAVLGGYHLSVMKEKAHWATSFPDLVRMAEETIALDAGTVRDDEYAGEIGPILDEVISLQEAISAGRREPGYSWGISELDDSMLLRAGKLYTVAAQKGSGKTKLCRRVRRFRHRDRGVLELEKLVVELSIENQLLKKAKNFARELKDGNSSIVSGPHSRRSKGGAK